MKHKWLLLYSWFVRALLYFFPDFPQIMRFRGFLYGLGMRSCGKYFQVANNVYIKDLENIHVGLNVFIANNSIIMGSGSIRIENEVLVGPNSVIISGNHTFENGSYRFGGSAVKGVVEICKGSWIAANCTIASGAKLPSGSVLSANSFLNSKEEHINAIYSGVPATLVKVRK